MYIIDGFYIVKNLQFFEKFNKNKNFYYKIRYYALIKTTLKNKKFFSLFAL